MSTLIGLVRGINVGGRQKLPMQTLRELLEGLGFTRVRTMLQSGNVVFDTKATKPSHLEKILDTAIRERVGMEVDFLVRTPEEFRAVIARNPFPAEAASDPARLLVNFLRTPVDQQKVDQLRAVIRDGERLEAKDREAYLFFPQGMATTRITNAVLEKYLGRCTGRNWNTVTKLLELSES